MARVTGIDPKVSVDGTGGIISVLWYCPHCGEYNGGMYFSSRSDILEGDFEVDHECEYCGQMVTIECRGAEKEF